MSSIYLFQEKADRQYGWVMLEENSYHSSFVSLNNCVVRPSETQFPLTKIKRLFKVISRAPFKNGFYNFKHLISTTRTSAISI